MLVFLLGVLTGVFLVLLIAYVYLFSSLETFDKSASPFVDQFQPVRLAPVLRNFLKSSREDPNKPKWESCYILSLVLHFLYQEHNDTRRFRRWFHKRLQLELNDIVTRSTAGRLIQDIRIRDLSTGSQFPVLNGASCEGYRLSEDKEHFDWLSILLDIDYKGAFQASIDVSLLFGRYAQLSVKVAELSGKARLTLTREPYTHWTFAFVETPFLDFKVESQWQGKQLKHLIPLITQQFRRIIQRKHVFPNYKIRYRPFFNNPLLMPSPPIGAFDHIKLIGGLEVTVLQCTRLNTSLAALDHSEVYCTVCIEHRPFTHNTTSNSLQSTTLLVNFMRHGLMEPLGLSFINSANELGLRTVQINAIESGSAAERCGFLKGDTILAINNVPIQSDRQVSRLLCGSVSELNVLIERGINDSNCTSPQLNVDPEEVNVDDEVSDDDGYLICGKSSSDIGNQFSENAVKKHSGLHRQRSHSTSTLPNETVLCEDFDTTLKGKDDANMYGSHSSVILSEIIASCPEPEGTNSELLADFELRKTRSVASFSGPSSEMSSEKGDNLDSRVVETLIIPSETTSMNSVALSSSPQDVSVENIQFLREGEKNIDKKLNPSQSVSTNQLITQMKSSSVSNLSVRDDEVLSSPKGDFLKDNSRPASRRERIQARAAEVQARAAEMAAAGKARVSDLWYRRKDLHSSQVELAAEALSNEMANESSPSASPLLKPKRERLRAKTTIESPQKSPMRKKREMVPSSDDVEFKQLSEKSHTEAFRSRSTKSLTLNENILWGQSLHFVLSNKSSKYVNVSVCSRCSLSRETDRASNGPTSNQQPLSEPSKPSMLGYVSIPLKQILADCQLTSSNCHREVFTLRPPVNPVKRRPESGSIVEASHHAGYDARLCYGDILLGFRYFPDGLPEGVALNQRVNDSSSDDEADERSVSSMLMNDIGEGRDGGSQSATLLCSQPKDHQFETISLKSGSVCAVCKGKIWLKTASRCTRCQLVCHNKCVAKISDNSHIPHIDASVSHFDDSNFEILDDRLLAESPNIPTFADDTISCHESVVRLTSEPPSFSQSVSIEGDKSNVTRRRRIANRVSEKWNSTWSRMGLRKYQSSPTKSTSSLSELPSHLTKEVHDDGSPGTVISVESVISDVFEKLAISGNLCQMKFQPGNAYNEEMINAAKKVGKDIFNETTELDKRKIKINDQINQIQSFIDGTTTERLKIIENARHRDESNVELRALNHRLEALAVLMLHYCAALQDCVDHEEELEKEKIVKKESSSGSKHENVARDESIVEEINARVDERCPLAIEEDRSVQHTNVHGSESECQTSHTSTAFNEERAESDDRDVS